MSNKDIDYSEGWHVISEMTLDELLSLDINSISEEDLDALSIALKKYLKSYNTAAVTKKLSSVYYNMLKRDMNNPCVSYYNIFEKLIIRYMGLSKYKKALELLDSYLLYDNKSKRAFKRDNFIIRNIAICNLALGNDLKAKQLFNSIIADNPDNYFNYHDIAFELNRLGYPSESVNYLKKGLEKASKSSNSTWHDIFYYTIESGF